MGSKNGQISGPCRAKRVGKTMCVDDTGPEQRSNKSINRQMVSEKTVVHSLYAYDWQYVPIKVHPSDYHSPDYLDGSIRAVYA